MISPFSAGAIVILLASLISAFFNFTNSPTAPPQFLLVIPSILMIFIPTSAGYALTAIAAVFLFPSISTTSPSLIPSLLIIPESILTIPLPASSLAVNSPIFNLSSLSSIIFPRSQKSFYQNYRVFLILVSLFESIPPK